ncbi:hypothetical protein G7043_34625 [Lentzea sp. NEAU-D13]|uniref:Double-GTPase 2 domain-containing protein n=1 Tax=Lentzea alba TaxID=2714351 RepID=A0A7C9RVQ8_9PSEU|nr:hypothetical protein [Lentzea alba]NGY64069.1 hypothetical protein [Lentzea alba]
MTAPPEPQHVLCPICLGFFPWREDELYRPETDQNVGGRWVKVDLAHLNNPIVRTDRRGSCYVKCPNPGREHQEHFLPITYRDHGEPIIIGLIGSGRSGKTHLLATMIHAALRGGLRHHGLDFEPADELRHEKFEAQVKALMQGEKLGATEDLKQDFTTYLLVRTPGDRARPVVFFDVAGEDFNNPGKQKLGGQFVLAATALMFVDQPTSALPSLFGLPDNELNPAIDIALKRIKQRPGFRDLPVAVVLTKADEIRYADPVDHWLRRDDTRAPLDAAPFRAESRDLYAFLDQHGAPQLLKAFETFARGTLHAVSATGSPVDENGRYPRGVRPARVLQPLLALLAMIGLVEHPAAAEVGR